MSHEIEKQIKELREETAVYSPCSTLRFEREKPPDPPKVLRIGLFGPPGVGKSALINSLNFATMDKDKGRFAWVSIAPEGYSDAPAKTLSREAFCVAENIEIIDNRGMRRLGGRFMVELGHQLAGVYGDVQHVEWDVGFIRSIAPRLERAFRRSKECEVHCTVLVISALNLSIRATDLKELLDQIKKMTGKPPIVVITHRKSARENDIAEFLKGLQREGFDYVYGIENYTRENHEYDPEKHLELLNILHQCTVVGDRVIKFKDTQGGCIIL